LSKCHARDSIKIGEFSLIGAGALVMKDTRPGSVYLGAQRAFSKTSEQWISTCRGSNRD
jgi:acetyltransferase-like isoleucine patch superfamily enzyme